MKTGRPTIITDELLAKAKKYADGGYMGIDVIPSIAGLAYHLGIHRATIYAHSEEFNDTLERIKQNQERLLLNGGLTGEFNATLTKLLLTNHGYSDKQETEIKSSHQPPIFQVVGVSPNHKMDE